MKPVLVHRRLNFSLFFLCIFSAVIMIPYAEAGWLHYSDKCPGRPPGPSSISNGQVFSCSSSWHAGRTIFRHAEYLYEKDGYEFKVNGINLSHPFIV